MNRPGVARPGWGFRVSNRFRFPRKRVFVFGARFDKVPAMRTVIYPGSFDPITNGHMDVIQRATKLFDRVVVAVARSESKHPLFTLQERKQMVARAVRHLRHVEADAFEGPLA